MLRTLASIGRKGLLTIQAGTEYNKATLKSMHYQGWMDVVDNPRKREFGFRINQEGVKALSDFENGDIVNHINKYQYSSYFQHLSPAFEGKFKPQQDKRPKQTVNISHIRRRNAA